MTYRLSARSFTDCGYMREQGEGIPRMFQVMEATDLHPPELTIQDVRFVVTLRNTPVYDEEALRWLRRFADLDLSQDQKRVLALAASRDKRFTSRDVQKKLGLDLYGASQLIKALIRKGAVRLPQKGGRVYEVVDPGEPAMLPDEVAVLLLAFRHHERLPRRSLQVIWGVKPHRAYQRARALVEAGWLELDGTGRGAAYRLTERARNARVSRQNTTVSRRNTTLSYTTLLDQGVLFLLRGRPRDRLIGRRRVIRRDCLILSTRDAGVKKVPPLPRSLSR